MVICLFSEEKGIGSTLKSLFKSSTKIITSCWAGCLHLEPSSFHLLLQHAPGEAGSMCPGQVFSLLGKEVTGGPDPELGGELS